MKNIFILLLVTAGLNLFGQSFEDSEDIFPELQEYLDLGYVITGQADDDSRVTLLHHHTEALFWWVTLYAEKWHPDYSKMISLYEVDFALKRARSLSVSGYPHYGEVETLSQVSDWSYAMPGSMLEGMIEMAKEIIREADDGSITSGMTGGGLSNRRIIYQPEIFDNSQKTGIVVINVCVDPQGNVTSASYTRRGSSTTDPDLKALSVETASRYRFSPADIDKQCGTITFDFKVQ